jgi:polysaccharide deacetylase 2 family uncharacterized protein YibQ
MVTTKQKRKSKEKKIDPKFLLLILAGLLGFIVTLGFFRILSHSDLKISPPLFEEIYSKTSDLNTEIRKIDNAIYDSLYQEEVSEKNIIFAAVNPKHGKGYDWDFTKLLIKLPKNASVFELEKTVNNELSQLRPSVSFRVERISKNEVIWHILAQGFYSHEIRLVHEVFRDTVSKDKLKKYKGLPKIAIIIDDLGYDRHIATSFIQYDLPLSLSVLPKAPYTDYIVNEANKRGRELILHLPMEPKDYPQLNPGPGALLLGMNDGAARKTINDHLNRISGIRGVNNHMGSSYTEIPEKMAVVLTEIKKRNLFYIDSITTNKTVAFKLAKKMGIPAASRNIFLDNDLSPDAIMLQVKRLLSLARHSGAAIGIGHPHRETLDVLMRLLHELKTEVVVVPVSDLVS